MIVPYHSIHKSSYIVTQVFYSPYYEDEAQVKCSLSRSDGNSNQFLTIWRVIPHTNHTHWSSELLVTVLHYPGPIRGFDRHRPYSSTIPPTKVSKVYQGCGPYLRHSPQPTPIQCVHRADSWPRECSGFTVRTTYPSSYMWGVDTY